jgi:hypothetical protein
MNTDAIDAGRPTLALNDLRLPTIKTIWPDFAARADKEGRSAARFLASLAEQEMAEPANRRIRRNVDEALMPVANTLDSFDFDAVPLVSEAQVTALAAAIAGSIKAQIDALWPNRRKKIRPSWCKLHLGVDAHTGHIVVAQLRTNDVDAG